MLHLIALEYNVLELLGCFLNLGGEEEAGRRDLQRERGRERQHEPWPTPICSGSHARASRPDIEPCEQRRAAKVLLAVRL